MQFFKHDFVAPTIPNTIFNRIHRQEKIRGGAIVYENKLICQIEVYAPRNIRSGMEKFTGFITIYEDDRIVSAYGEASGCGYDKRHAAILNACKTLGLDVQWRNFILRDIAETLRLNVENCCFIDF